MGYYIDALTRLTRIPETAQTTPSQKRAQVAQIVQNSAVDSVNFSRQAQDLFGISRADTFFDATFGLPATLNSSQKKELSQLQEQLRRLLPADTSPLESSQIFGSMKDLLARAEVNASSSQLATLQDAIHSYVYAESVGNLFGSSDTLQSGGSLTTLLASGLSDEEQQRLGKLSLQLNRLFFTGAEDSFLPLLEEYNTLYGLNTPSREDLLKASTLFDTRNTLLAQTLSRRSAPETYSGLRA